MNYDSDKTQFVASLEHVTQRYGKVCALNDVTLNIPSGRMVGIIGPDGVGKSTMFSLLSGARALQEGSMMVLSGDISSAVHRKAICPQIAYMPQGLGKNLYPTLSVFENVDFFGRLFGHDRAERERRIATLLKATGLSPFAGRPAGTPRSGVLRQNRWLPVLSGGRCPAVSRLPAGAGHRPLRGIQAGNRDSRRI